jgi:hypothetical protein
MMFSGAAFGPPAAEESDWQTEFPVSKLRFD